MQKRMQLLLVSAIIASTGLGLPAERIGPDTPGSKNSLATAAQPANRQRNVVPHGNRYLPFSTAAIVSDNSAATDQDSLVEIEEALRRDRLKSPGAVKIK